MLKVKIENKTFKFPKDWANITIERYIKFQELIAKYGEDTIKDFADETKDQSDFILFCADVVAFWGDIPKELINKCDITDIYNAFNALQKYFELPKPQEDFKGFTFKGTYYKLPEKHMRGSSLVEYLEGMQIEKSSSELEAGNWKALPQIIGIIARPEGEEYDSKKLELRTQLFMGLDMNTVNNVAFFDQTKQHITETFAALFGGGGSNNIKFIKAGGDALNSNYGWYLTLKQVAESGIFNISGLTALRSAEIADLYEVFTYLSAVKAENDVQQEMMKLK